ncbi:MAG: hypothetical protein QXK90_01275 [Candidatus Parvarchaeota archaeon]|nr:hypothetical protein [Candidatus Parvarchaeota archaeon]
MEGSAGNKKQDYLKLFNVIVGSMSEMMGKELTLKYARRAPLVISPDGVVEDFYGDGNTALKILTSQYKGLAGDVVYKLIATKIEASKINVDPQMLLELIKSL